MAYVKKFEATFYNDATSGASPHVAKEYVVELLLKDGAAGSAEIPVMGSVPGEMRTIIASKGDVISVVGSEFVFTFKTDSPATYDSIFESEYRDWRMDVYEDSVLHWRGYIQVDNLSKSVFDEYVEIQLSATDAIKDLAETEFRDNAGDPHTGIVPVIEAISMALEPLELPGDFYIKLNTHETNETPDKPCLLYTYIYLERFNRIENGGTKVDSCLDVIEKLIAPFGLVLRQYGGNYYLINPIEGNTTMWLVDGDTLALTSSAAAGDLIDIDASMFGRDADMSAISPVKQLDITHYNSNPGLPLVANLNVFSGVDSPWYIQFTSYTTEGGSNEILVVEIGDEEEAFDGDGYAPRYMELLSQFQVEKLTENDRISFSCKVVVRNEDNINTQGGVFVTDGNNGAWVIVTVTEVATGRTSIQELQIYASLDIDVSIDVVETGDYTVTVELRIAPLGASYYGEFLFSEFDLRRAVLVDGKWVYDITFDTMHRCTSDRGKRHNTAELWFADSGTTGDVGRYMLYDAPDYIGTETWVRSGKAESISLVQAYATNYLAMFSRYANYLYISVFDFAASISPINRIQFDSVTYLIETYEKEYAANRVTLRLREVLSTDPTVGIESEALNTADGRTAADRTINVGANGRDVNVYVEDSPYPSIEKLMIRRGGLTSQITMLQKPRGLVSGGTVVWSGELWKFFVDAALFFLNGKLFRFEGYVYTPLTLTESDSFLSRIDTLVLKAGTIGEGDVEPYEGLLEVLEGEEAETPIASVPDGSQVKLTDILILAGSSSFENEAFEEIIYDEGVEWAVLDEYVPGFDFQIDYDLEDTSDPYRGTKALALSIPAVPTFDWYNLYLRSASVFSAPEMYEFGLISLWLKLSAAIPEGEYIALCLREKSDVFSPPPERSLLGYIQPTYGYGDATSTDWQHISIPLRDLQMRTFLSNISSAGVDVLEIRASSGCPDFLMDYIKFGGGITQPTPVTAVQLVDDVLADGELGYPIQTALAEITTAKTVGSATKIPVVTVDAKGRVTTATEIDLVTGEAPPLIVASEVVYDEGGEWTKTADGGATFDYAATTNPYHGTKHIRATTPSGTVYIEFTAPTPLDIADYTHVQFALYMADDYTALGKTIYVTDTEATMSGVAFTVESTTGAYQIVTVALADLLVTLIDYEKLTIEFDAYDTEGGFDLDFVRFVKIGTPQTVEGDIYVYDADVTATDTGTLPTPTNTNNIINVELLRTDAESVELQLGSMAAYKAWVGEEGDLPAGWDETTDTIYMTYEDIEPYTS